MHKGEPSTVVGIGVAAVNLGRHAKGVEGGFGLPLVKLGDTQVVVGLGIARINHQGLLQDGLGVSILPQMEVNNAPLEVRLWGRGDVLPGLLKGDQGFGVALLNLIHQSQVVIGIAQIGLNGDRPQ